MSGYVHHSYSVNVVSLSVFWISIHVHVPTLLCANRVSFILLSTLKATVHITDVHSYVDTWTISFMLLLFLHVSTFG